MKEYNLKITYDNEADAAYIYLTPSEPQDGTATKQIEVQADLDAEIILDVTDANKLQGIEILGASNCLPEELLKAL